MTNRTMQNCYDAVIVGGGISGLASALTLGRASRKIAILDSQLSRNRFSHQMNNVIGSDGVNPTLFKERITKELLEKYKTVSLFHQTVVKIEEDGKEKYRFKIETNTHQYYYARRLVLASGVKDIITDSSYSPIVAKFIQEQWGKLIFHCPFCDGFEKTGQKWGLLLNSYNIPHSQAPVTSNTSVVNSVPIETTQTMSINDKITRIPFKMWQHFFGILKLFTSEIVILANGLNTETLFSTAEIETLKKNNISIIHDKIKNIHANENTEDSHASTVGIEFEDSAGNKPIELGCVFMRFPLEFSDFIKDLNLQLSPMGLIAFEENTRKSLSNPYIFPTGDVIEARSSVSLASGLGTLTGAFLCGDLGAEDFLH